MKLLFFVAVLLFASLALCDCDQLDGTTWACTGGSATYPIQYFSFDDDEFQLYLQYDDCTVFQEGNFEVDGDTVSVDFGLLDDCETSDNNQCECYEDFDMDISNDCLNIVGPNGETCVPQGDCAMQTCGNGQTPIQDPNYEPSTNECGPSSIPFGAPSFAFSECCNNHDLCYPVCGKEKRTCDYEFYSCMACACEDAYDTNVGEELCLVLACLYFQAVDEFGCGAYEDSQDNGCICQNNAKAIDAPREYQPVRDKFGGSHSVHEALELYSKGTLGLADFVCDAPLDPQCPSENSNNSNSNNSNSNNSNSNNSNSNNSNSNNSNSNNSSSASALVAGALTVLAAALI